MRFGPPSIITLPFPGFQMFQNTAPPWESIRPETGTALPPHFSSESALFAIVWKWKGNRRRHRQPRNKDERCMRLPQARSSDQPAFLYGQSSDCDNCTPGNCMIRFEPEDRPPPGKTACSLHFHPAQKAALVSASAVAGKSHPYESQQVPGNALSSYRPALSFRKHTFRPERSSTAVFDSSDSFGCRLFASVLPASILRSAL